MPDGAGAYPAYGQGAAVMPDGANAYPVYGQGAAVLPDGAGAYPAYGMDAVLCRPDKATAAIGRFRPASGAWRSVIHTPDRAPLLPLAFDVTLATGAHHPAPQIPFAHRAAHSTPHPERW